MREFVFFKGIRIAYCIEFFVGTFERIHVGSAFHHDAVLGKAIQREKDKKYGN
jgi:hypothetical protein